MNCGEALVQPSDATILEHFADLDDPRVERTRRHKLVDIIAIAICATICGADYVLAVKENQGQLYQGIRDLFQEAEASDFDGVPYHYAQTVNKGHGRVERRECWVVTAADCLDYLDPQGQWPQLKAAIKVVGHRKTAEGSASQPRYYISSLAAPAEQLLAAIRGHWSIENSLHWTLDVTFHEDQRRVRKSLPS